MTGHRLLGRVLSGLGIRRWKQIGDGIRQDLFDAKAVDEKRRANNLLLPTPSVACIIHFTPRSGSSWLTEVLSATKQLGRANEAFNPGFIPKIARGTGARDLQEYVPIIMRHFNTNGVFSAEVNAHHVTAVYGDYAPFHSLFPNARHIWLIREDIVEQAVSLTKMVATRVKHAQGTNAQILAAADRKFPYNPAAIAEWLNHIHTSEKLTEGWIETYDLKPLRLSYERMMEAGANRTQIAVARHLGLADFQPTEVISEHRKIGTPQNSEYAQRFRQDRALLVSSVEAERRERLTLL